MKKRAFRLFLPLLLLLCVQCESPTGPGPETGGETERPPPAPLSLRTVILRAGEIELVWTDMASNETRFEIESRAGAESRWSALTTTPPDRQRYQHTGLRAGDTYFYRVRACNGGGCSAFSHEASATVTSPAAPSDLTALASTSGRIDLVWKDNSQDEASFHVEYRKAPDTQWYTLARTAADVTVLAHTDLRTGTTYAYRVRACSDAGCSPHSGDVLATVSGPRAPSDLKAELVGSGRIDLRWQDNSSDEASFRIDYREGSETQWYTLASVPPNTITHSHTGLAAGVSYTYRVSSCNAAGCSDPSAEVQAVVAGPVAPSNLSATAVGSGRVEVRWQDNSSDETSFRIEYREAPSTQWYVLASTATNINLYSHTGLKAGITYSYRVRSCNASGCSEALEEVQAGVAGPAAPSNLAAAPVGSGRIDVRWQDNSADEASFRIEYREAPSTQWYVLASTQPNATTYPHTGLRAGTTYSYRVRACNDAGCSANSNEAQATVLGPVAPSALTATAKTGEIVLAWRDNSGDEDRFELQYRSASSTTWLLLVRTTPGATTYTHSGLRAGDAYVYRVRSCNVSGCSAFSNEAGATVAGSDPGTGLLPAPTLISPSNGATGVSVNPTFSWSAVTGADRYWLMVATDPGVFPTDPNATSCPGCVISGNLASTSYTPPGSFLSPGKTTSLSANTRYYWKVQAWNSNPKRQGSYPAASTFTARSGSPPALTCPSGWVKVYTQPAVVLCYAEYQRGGARGYDYVIQADLKQGAQILNLHEAQTTGSASNPSPLFKKWTIGGWWERYPLGNRFCMVSGTFFMNDSPLEGLTELSFPFRDRGYLLTVGADTKDRPSDALYVFSIDSRQASIRRYTLDTVKDFHRVDADLSNARMSIVGFRGAGGADRRPYGVTELEGQTFVAIRDRDNDTHAETVLFYVSSLAQPAHVVENLRDLFHVPESDENMLRLDGGSSSQLTCGDGTYMRGPIIRSIPHVFGIFQAPG